MLFIQTRLQAYYRQTFRNPPNAQIVNLHPLSQGWESDVYAFDVTYPDSERPTLPLVLRIYPGEDAYAKSRREYRGMQVLHRVGYPVPRVLSLARDNSPFDRPFMIMERIAGVSFWGYLDTLAPEAARTALTRFCELFVRLHQLNWQPFLLSEITVNLADPYFWVDREIKQWRAFAARYPQPGFEPLFEWLVANRVPCSRPAPVHWDFHPGNVILKPDGDLVVIDWTQINASDPRFDLAWTLLLVPPAWRQHILDEYQRLSGEPITHMSYFEVAACAKRLFSVTISMTYGPEKLGMRPDAVAMMQSQLPALRNVYNFMLERVDIRIPEVENLLANA